MKNIEHPIFIVGVGRSGSTIFHKMLANHPQLVWLSQFNSKFPKKILLSSIVQGARHCPVCGSFVRRFVLPSEGYPFWENICPGFRDPHQDLLASDVTPEKKLNIKKSLSKLLTQKRSRLLIKITGWPRVGFLKEIFPDAKFIHVVRDGRAVVQSLTKVSFWQAWERTGNWRMTWLEQELKKNHPKIKPSGATLAAMFWRLMIESMEKATKGLSSKQILQIKYEDLCQDPKKVFSGVLAFSELDHDGTFEKRIDENALRCTNDKFEQEFTKEQQKMIVEIIGAELKRFGYAV